MKIKGQDNNHNDYTIKAYGVGVDSVTGELLNIGQERTLKKDVSLAFDLALEKNSGEIWGRIYASGEKAGGKT